jgi:hypothetical protein
VTFSDIFNNTFANVPPTDVAKGLIYPIILLTLTSIGSGIRLYYLSLQGKNRYISLLKKNFHHIEKFLNTTEKFKRMSLVFFLQFLIFGAILGGLIYIAIASIWFIFFVIIVLICLNIDISRETFGRQVLCDWCFEPPECQ